MFGNIKNAVIKRYGNVKTENMDEYINNDKIIHENIQRNI